MAEFPQKGHDTMTVAALLHQLEQFDDDTEVIIVAPGDNGVFTLAAVNAPEDEDNCEVALSVGEEIK